MAAAAAVLAREDGWLAGGGFDGAGQGEAAGLTQQVGRGWTRRWPPRGQREPRAEEAARMSGAARPLGHGAGGGACGRPNRVGGEAAGRIRSTGRRMEPPRPRTPGVNGQIRPRQRSSKAMARPLLPHRQGGVAALASHHGRTLQETPTACYAAQGDDNGG